MPHSEGTSTTAASPLMPRDSSHLVREAIFEAFREASKTTEDLLVVVGWITKAEANDREATAAIEAIENFILFTSRVADICTSFVCVAGVELFVSVVTKEERMIPLSCP
jgi:hypothetical protein